MNQEKIQEIAKNRIDEIENIKNPAAYDYGWNYGAWLVAEGSMDIDKNLDIEQGRKKSENEDIPDGDYKEMKKLGGIDLSTSCDYWDGFWDAINSIHSEIYSKIKISVPNDYGSREREEMAIAELYDGDREACEGDNGQLFFDRLSDIAEGAGLEIVESTDFGNIWIGTKEEIEKAKNDLPGWASISEVEEN